MQPEDIQKDVKNQLASPKTILHNEDTKNSKKIPAQNAKYTVLASNSGQFKNK